MGLIYTTTSKQFSLVLFESNIVHIEFYFRFIHKSSSLHYCTVEKIIIYRNFADSIETVWRIVLFMEI